ncbi:MAG: EcsC family protein [Polaromonas sp.]|uniref:EcsC family protein n=1 Tax=Polaromonas sp. TaxID=1869339 RepID=UPI0024897F12|nr:EcsC family protein [Polaromonas sp.]MDI1269478.1 EcsC family protein [Polaromonas sp.]
MTAEEPPEATPQGKVLTALNWAYEKTLMGFPGLDSAEEMASEYTRGTDTLNEQVNSLIRWQVTKAGTSGFLSGLGGLIVLPVTIPANVASVMYVQVRMIAAIAIMGGHNVKDDRVRSLVYACLTGNAIKDILKDAGLVVGMKIGAKAIENIAGKTIVAINQKIGFRLLTKFGEKGVVNMGKMVPILGGIIGGTIDASTTNIIGNVARNTFIDGVVK